MVRHFPKAILSVFALLLLAGCAKPQVDSKPSSAVTSAIRDCADCPEMVPISAGTYLMGSPPSERYRAAETQHSVSIPAFAVSKYEITFDEWDACVKDGGCKDAGIGDEGWGRGKMPVIYVDWNDAKAYVAWLSKKTGKTYRLLSESEWEYAARAGTKTAFFFGDTLSPDQANFDGSSITSASGTPGLNRQKTMPVGSFPPNAFGLYDMHGNVWEWVEDCWNDEYTGAPADGSAWLQGDCRGRILRGGSWEDYPGELRSAARVGGSISDRDYGSGFRVARAL